MTPPARGFTTPVSDSELPIAASVLTLSARILSVTMALSSLAFGFALTLSGEFEADRFISYTVTGEIVFALHFAATYTGWGRRWSQSVFFSLVLSSIALILGSGYQSAGSINHFAMVALLLPVALAAFAPWRPVLSIATGVFAALGYAVLVEWLPWKGAIPVPLGAATALISGTLGAWACQSQRRTLAELAGQRQVAEAAARARSEFLANMSHEIRTPMTAILGFTDELILDAEREANGAGPALLTIKRNGERLVKIVNDILDLSKIEVGRLRVQYARCSPRDLVEDVAGLMRRSAEEKQLRLEVRVRDSVPEHIESDATRLRQILANLVDNAIKFTESGGVSIGVRAEDDRLYFEIADTGIGLTDEELGSVFMPFTQVDGSMTRKHAGTGLGLTLARALTRLLGGEIAAASEPGEGSVFRVSVPFAPSERALPESGESTEIPERLEGSLLLAEDGIDNQRLISRMLERAGLEVETAENGRQAVYLAQAAAEGGQPFDVILMDMQMPEMTGYEATRILRESDYTGPIIALTAQAMSGDREECLRAGCDEYTSKPIDRDALLRLIVQFLDKRS